MELVLQSPSRPTTVLYALQSMAVPDTPSLRVAVAYTTYKGSRTFVDLLSGLLPAWDQIPKFLITSLDFGHTDPSALEFFQNIPNAEVRITSSNFREGEIQMMPRESNFHPKIYLFGAGVESVALVGSPNLSERAMSASTEAAVIVQPAHDLEEYWQELVSDSQILTPEMLQAYKEARQRRRAIEPDPPVEPISPRVPADDLRALFDAIADNELDPSAFECFWIEAGSMSSGGSHNQLELPRGANNFFGFAFSDYDDDHHVVGNPTLLTPGRSPWTDRKLTWHGNNRMERINLPTEAQSGLNYANTAILFRRSAGGFALQVAPWDSNVAESWRNASEEDGATYRVGRTDRICGFF